MKVQTPQIAWHNRDRVSSVSIQPFAYPTPTKEGGTRIATCGDDCHVVVSGLLFYKQDFTRFFNQFKFLKILCGLLNSQKVKQQN